MMDRHIHEVKTWNFFNAAWHCNQTARELLVQLVLAVDRDATMSGLQSVFFCSLLLSFAWVFETFWSFPIKENCRCILEMS